MASTLHAKFSAEHPPPLPLHGNMPSGGEQPDSLFLRQVISLPNFLRELRLHFAIVNAQGGADFACLHNSSGR